MITHKESFTKFRLVPLIVLVVMLSITDELPAQDAGKVEEQLNLLVAPSSVGLSLLDVDASSVSRPQTPTDIIVTVRNKTNEFTEIPSEFGLDLQPYWVLGGGGATYEELAGDEVTFRSILQNFRVSLATKSRIDSSFAGTDSLLTVTSSDFAIGLNLPIARGKRSSETIEHFKAIKDGLKGLNRILRTKLDSARKNSESYQILSLRLDTLEGELSSLTDAGDDLQKQLDAQTAAQKMAEMILNDARIAALKIEKAAILAQQEKLEAEMKDVIFKSQSAELEAQKKLVADAPNERIGFKLELAGGIVTDVPGQDFDKARLRTAGIWVTGGYESKSLGFLGVARSLADGKNGDRTSWDIGGRIVADVGPQLSCSIEAAYRFINMYAGANMNTWRTAFRADYLVGKNKSLAVTFGRDFEGKKSGTLLTLVQLVLGFGSARPIDS